MSALTPSRLGFAFLSLAAALLAVGCGTGPRRNVVVIVVDTLRADHLGAYGYERDTSPEIDRLASEGTLFRRAYSATSWTKPAVASILTGLYPKTHGVQRVNSTLADDWQTLAEALSEQGWATAGVISHTLLSADSGYGQGFDVYLEEEARGHAHVSTPGVTDQALSLLDAFASDPDRPFFLFVHYFDPHYTYVRHPEIGFAAERAGRLTGHEDIQVLRDMSGDLTEEELGFLVDLYDEEIRFTDAGIGRLLDGLAERGLADDTLVVLTSDHGEEFLERGWLGHTRTLYDELIRVPLIVRAPWMETPPSINRPVSVVSLAPTVLDALGVETEIAFDEPSLVPQLAGEPFGPTRFHFAEVDFVPVYSANAAKAASKVTLIGPRYKIHWDRQRLEHELYDVYQDPGERENVADEKPGPLVRLLPVVREHAKQKPNWLVRPPTERLQFDEEQREHLRALGYADS